MSQEDSDCEISEADLPPAAECEERCQRFAQVTGTDSALAMLFLQNQQWNLNRALDAFFEQGVGAEGSAAGANKKSEKGSPGQLKQDKTDETAVADPQPHRIRVLSWNIDGLSSEYLKQRTKAVIDTIKREKAEVVFLQELVLSSAAVLQEGLGDYRFVFGDGSCKEGYFTAILLHKSYAMLEDYTVVPFPASQMGRNLLLVTSIVKEVPLTFMTSHLESTKAHETERKHQLQICLKQIKDTSPSQTVLFGGDLNLRDKELESLGGLPEGILDMWEATGCRKEAKYTWDTFRNDNLSSVQKWRTKLRFDRLFLRHCRPGPMLKAVYFELVGLERLAGVRCFPSDHWGILTHFDITNKAKK